MFQQRQLNEIYGSVEVSNTAATSPGAITGAATVIATVACTLQGTTNAASFALGDNLEVIAPASAALNGVDITATPTATPGTCILIFDNSTGVSVTPTASSVYKIIAKRFRNDLI
jgi:hypothetical protein